MQLMLFQRTINTGRASHVRHVEVQVPDKEGDSAGLAAVTLQSHPQTHLVQGS
jgi:hypothetical protein